ncbi:MAG: hypothetical protein ACTSPI_13650 [Candidatus Heimdallarchaeaceae archaeon]
MSLYKIQSLLDNIPKILGQDDENGSAASGQEQLSNTELIERARKLGLRVPKHY